MVVPRLFGPGLAGSGRERRTGERRAFEVPARAEPLGPLLVVLAGAPGRRGTRGSPQGTRSTCSV